MFANKVHQVRPNVVSVSGDVSIVCIAFRKRTIRRKTIKPRPGTTVQISIDPYSAGKATDEKEKVTKPPARIGPRPLPALPPTITSEFIFARCVDGTVLLMATAIEAKYSDCINFVTLIKMLKNHLDGELPTIKSDKGISNVGTVPMIHPIIREG
jgi:hypothetical protein